MANPDFNSLDVRKKIIDTIKSDENKRRKAESLKRFEVYKERQDKWIVKKLREEFSEKTIKDMRKLTSINLAPRMINASASLYDNAPSRFFSNANEAQAEQLENIYFESQINSRMKQANRLFKLHSDQVLVQVVPKNGNLWVRPLHPHHVDVVPDAFDPETPYAVIVSVFDKFEFLPSDGVNQIIADKDDYKASLERYEVWTPELNFIMNGRGEIVSGDEVVNPIGELPFVDISADKDFEFWSRSGSGFVEFAIEFGAALSDLSNIVRFQSYAQAVMIAEKAPEAMTIGVNHVLFLEQDPNKQKDPSFQFVSPSPDIASSLEFLEMTIRLFLASKGIDPKTISGKLEGQSFSSGVERLLAMIQKFESSKSEMELFRSAEDKIFGLLVKWSNLLQNTDQLKDKLQLAFISEDTDLEIEYQKPESVQTKSEVEDSVIKLLKEKLMTRKDALMELKGFNEDMAEKKLAEIDADREILIPVVVQPTPVIDDEQEQAEAIQ